MMSNGPLSLFRSFQSGWRSSLNLSLTRVIGTATTARGTVRWGGLDARIKPESLRQWGGDVLLAHQFSGFTVFAEAGYTRTHGLATLFLFGKARRDRRLDLGGGIVFNRLSVGGFSPLVRLTYTDSKAAIQLYDFRRTRLDFGFSRSF